MEDTQKEILDVLAKLVSIPSVADNKDALQKIIAYVKDYLSMPELIIEEYTHNDFPSLLIKPKSWQKTKLLLNAHVDVVPANKDQFTLKIQRDKAYGRGTLDMKGATAVLLVLIKKLAMEKKLPETISLMIVTDEEVGGHNGTKYLLEEKRVITDFFLAGEPTNLTICNRQKGVLWVKLEEAGKRAHASKPWLGKNANISLIEKLAKFYRENPELQQEKWMTTYNLAVMNGGDAINVVPDKSIAIIDVRRIESESSNVILKKIRESFPEANLTILEDEPCLITDDKDKSIIDIQKALQNKFGKITDLTRETFASDGRFYSVKGIPSINFGPSGEDMHGINEYVSIESLFDYYQYLHEIVLKTK